MKFWAILKDSFYETIDFKLFYVLIGFSLFLAVVCLSFTFHPLPKEEAIARNLRDNARSDASLPGPVGRSIMGGATGPMDPSVDVSEFGPVADQPNRYQMVLTPKTRENFGRAILQTAHIRKLVEDAMSGHIRMRSIGEMFKQLMTTEKPPDSEAGWKSLIEKHLNSFSGITNARVTAVDTTTAQAPTRIVADMDIDWIALPHSHQMGILFGVWKVDIRRIGEMVFIFQTALVEWIAGWAGLIVSLVITAGFIPNMLQKGSVDLLLVKPIHRWFLLLSKYLGGMIFVLFNGVVLIGTSWLALGYNSGNWSPWYLASIGVLLFYFTILYSLSVLMGVLTRNTIVSILVTIGFWFILFLISRLYLLSHLSDNIIDPNEFSFPPLLVSIIDWVHYVLPKTGTLAYLNSQLLMKANDSVEMYRHINSMMPSTPMSWTETLLTSSGFIIVMLTLACWRFARRDY